MSQANENWLIKIGSTGEDIRSYLFISYDLRCLKQFCLITQEYSVYWKT